jgi:uncharacterized protein with PQ loop repeat
MTILDTLGLIGSIALGICNLPQAILSYKNQSSKGISLYTLIIGFLGCATLFLYFLLKLPNEIFLIFNYLFNMACLSTILYYYFWGKNV